MEMEIHLTLKFLNLLASRYNFREYNIDRIMGIYTQCVFLL